MISKNLILKDCLYNPYGDGELSNVYSYHAEQTHKSLQYIYDNPKIYCSAFYSLLVNNFEIMYKGALEEYSNIYPSYRPNQSLMNSHRLEELANEIYNRILTINDEYKFSVFLDKLSKFSDGYTRSRYAEIYEYSDFSKLWSTYQRQREAVYTEIDKLQKNKDNISFDDIELDI